MLRKLYYVYKMNKSHHTPFILFVFFPSVESVALCLQTTEMNKSSKQMIPLFVQKLSKHHSVKMEVVFFCAFSPLTSAVLFLHLEPQTIFLQYSLCPDD